MGSRSDERLCCFILDFTGYVFLGYLDVDRGLLQKQVCISAQAIMKNSFIFIDCYVFIILC